MICAIKRTKETNNEEDRGGRGTALAVPASLLSERERKTRLGARGEGGSSRGLEEREGNAQRSPLPPFLSVGASLPRGVLWWARHACTGGEKEVWRRRQSRGPTCRLCACDSGMDGMAEGCVVNRLLWALLIGKERGTDPPKKEKKAEGKRSRLNPYISFTFLFFYTFIITMDPFLYFTIQSNQPAKPNPNPPSPPTDYRHHAHSLYRQCFSSVSKPSTPTSMCASTWPFLSTATMVGIPEVRSCGYPWVWGVRPCVCGGLSVCVVVCPCVRGGGKEACY